MEKIISRLFKQKALKLEQQIKQSIYIFTKISFPFSYIFFCIYWNIFRLVFPIPIVVIPFSYCLISCFYSSNLSFPLFFYTLCFIFLQNLLASCEKIKTFSVFIFCALIFFSMCFFFVDPSLRLK